MKCPTCKDTVLVMSERQGIEIDYCPSCRGVWLDRGELDKLLEKSATPMAQTSERYEHNPQYRPHSKPYRKKSLLEEIFD